MRRAFWCFAAKTEEMRDEWIVQLQHVSGARAILTPSKEGMLMEEGKTLKVPAVLRGVHAGWRVGVNPNPHRGVAAQKALVDS